MTERNRPSAEDKSALNTPSQSKAKKPYHKPEFRFERAFETLALSCGKISPTQRTCKHNRKVS
jgi:hypothetical protein